MFATLCCFMNKPNVAGVRQMKRHIVLVSSIALTIVACASPNNNHITDFNTNPSAVDKKEMQTAESSLRTHKGLSTEDGILLSSQEKFNFYSFSPGFYPKVGYDDKHTYYSFAVGDGENPIGELGSAKKAPLVDRIKSIAVPKKDPKKFCVVTFYKFRNCTKSIEFQAKGTVKK